MGLKLRNDLEGLPDISFDLSEALDMLEITRCYEGEGYFDSCPS